jgi:hypothetical protein
MAIPITISPVGLGITNYTIRWRIKGASVWNTTGVTPANPQLSSTTSASIAVPNTNTVYEVQIISSCGSSTSQTPIFNTIERDCPTLLEQSITATDTSITASFPLNTPAPISSHVTSLVVELYQGLSLISTQTIAAPNTTNTLTFTGLNQSTTYTLKYTTTYAHSDSIPLLTYSNGGTANSSVCSVNVLTAVTPACPIVIITGLSQSA